MAGVQGHCQDFSGHVLCRGYIISPRDTSRHFPRDKDMLSMPFAYTLTLILLGH